METLATHLQIQTGLPGGASGNARETFVSHLPSWSHQLQPLQQLRCRSLCSVAHSASFYSSKQASSSLTLYTSLLLGQLPLYEAQCAAWPGPHAAAVLVPLVYKDKKGLQQSHKDQIEEAKRSVQAVFKR